jgi:hypothetical protein
MPLYLNISVENLGIGEKQILPLCGRMTTKRQPQRQKQQQIASGDDNKKAKAPRILRRCEAKRFRMAGVGR